MKIDYEKLHTELGDIAVLIEENYEDKEPLKDYVKASRQCFRDYIKNIHSALDQAEKEHKALEIIRKKNVWTEPLIHCGSVDEYNRLHFIDHFLTEEEYNSVREVLLG